MKRDRILILISAMSCAGLALAYAFLPERIPLQWDLGGEVSRWGARWNIFWMGALPLFLALLFPLLPRLDPRPEAYERHAKTYRVIQWLIIPALMIFGWVTVASSLGLPLDIGVLVRLVVGLLMAALGNYMGTLKRNYFVGIKTPWALADDEVWRLTHRRGGQVFVAVGLIFAISAFLPAGPALEIGLGAAIVAGPLYVFAYSWWCWRRRRGGRGAAGGGETAEAKEAVGKSPEA